MRKHDVVKSRAYSQRKPKWCIWKETFGLQSRVGSLNVESNIDEGVSLQLMNSTKEFSRGYKFADGASMEMNLQV